uniref:Putative effector protein n=1 Tax=Heterodera avenae TaxID=34510 RepID=A0A2L0VDM2_HETAV|nr:putative effector protein [Heterodera avenae]
MLYAKYFFVFLLHIQQILGPPVDSNSDWLEGVVKDVIDKKIPKDTLVPKLCDVSYGKRKAVGGEIFINYGIMFPTFKEEKKLMKYPKLSESARLGPDEAARRFRHFGIVFPEKISNNETLRAAYSNESGIMAREVRWERNVYCMKWLAHMLQKRAERNLSDSVVGARSIQYEEKNISVKATIQSMVEKANSIKKDIREYVTTKLDSNKMQIDEKHNAEILRKRMDLANIIDQVAMEEEKDGWKKASSMDMIVEYSYFIKNPAGEGSGNTNIVHVLISSVNKAWEISGEKASNDTAPPVQPILAEMDENNF